MIRPSHFSNLQIMPKDLIFKYRYLIQFNNSHHQDEVVIQKPCHNLTYSKAEFVPKRANHSRGERSLLTTGVNLRNLHLMGEEATEPLNLRTRLMASLWRGWFIADWVECAPSFRCGQFKKS